jgi:addiction module RelB/DinJ family antitoxin
MAHTALLQVRLDAELKKEVEGVLNGMGMDTSTAVRVFFKQIIAKKSIPFTITSAGERQNPEKREGLPPGIKKSGNTAREKRFPSMDRPVHLGASWKWNREELYDRNK